MSKSGEDFLGEVGEKKTRCEVTGSVPRLQSKRKPILFGIVETTADEKRNRIVTKT